MEDVEQVELEFIEGARRRGIRVLDAAFPVEPTVVMSGESVSVEDALDVVQQVFAPFISVSTTRLDLVELLEDVDGDDLPEDLRRRCEERAGQVDGVFVRWLAGGCVYLYVAVPEWRQELTELLEESSEERQARQDMADQGAAIRITHLAELVERDPAYRAATSQQRKAAGRRALEPELRIDEGWDTEAIVLEQAGRLVRANAAAAYAQLDEAELAAELRASEDFRSIGNAVARKRFVRNFLVQKSGGYGPANELVEALRSAAEAPRRRR